MLNDAINYEEPSVLSLDFLYNNKLELEWKFCLKLFL